MDRSLSFAELDFEAAFRKVRHEISTDYPFLHPSSEEFDYSNGKIKMTKQMNAKIFVAGISDALRRILDKLDTNPKFARVHHETLQRLVSVANMRAAEYRKFSMTPHIRRILGA